jgi:malate dehydrogenase (oxaloacetate-decarboxylating)
VPVLDDDQYGTAVVALPALANAARVTGRELSESHVVIVGAGADGAATARLLRSFGGQRISVVDSERVERRGPITQQLQLGGTDALG